MITPEDIRARQQASDDPSWEDVERAFLQQVYERVESTGRPPSAIWLPVANYGREVPTSYLDRFRESGWRLTRWQSPGLAWDRTTTGEWACWFSLDAVSPGGELLARARWILTQFAVAYLVLRLLHDIGRIYSAF